MKRFAPPTRRLAAAAWQRRAQCGENGRRPPTLAEARPAPREREAPARAEAMGATDGEEALIRWPETTPCYGVCS